MRKVKNTGLVRQSANEQLHKPIILRNSDGTFVFKEEEIVSIEACNNQVCFYTLSALPAEQKIIVSMGLKKAGEILNHLPFVKVNRSWIVNVAHVRAHLTKGGNSIRTVTNQNIPLSGSHNEQFVVAFEQFF